MRTWSRVLSRRHCGRCGREIARGEIVQWIALVDVSTPFVRGVCCAEGEPPELPELPPVAERPKRRRFVRSVQDWKTRQAGKDE